MIKFNITLFLMVFSLFVFGQGTITTCVGNDCGTLSINSCSSIELLELYFQDSYGGNVNISYRLEIHEGSNLRFSEEFMDANIFFGRLLPEFDLHHGYYNISLYKFSNGGFGPDSWDLQEQGTFVVTGNEPNNSGNEGLLCNLEIQSLGNSDSNHLVYYNDDNSSGFGNSLIHSETSGIVVADYISADITGDNNEEYIVALNGSQGGQILYKENLTDSWSQLYGPNSNFEITCLSSGQLDLDGKQELLVGFRRLSDQAGLAYWMSDVNATLAVFYGPNTTQEVTSIETGDFDNDSKDEIFVGFNSTSQNSTIYKLNNINSTFQLIYGPNATWKIRSIYAGDPDDNGNQDLYLGFNKTNGGGAIYKCDGDCQNWSTIYSHNLNWEIIDITGGKIGNSSSESIYYALNSTNTVKRGTVLKSDDGSSLGSYIECPYAGFYMKDIWLRENAKPISNDEDDRKSNSKVTNVQIYPNPMLAGSELNYSNLEGLVEIRIYSSQGIFVRSVEPSIKQSIIPMTDLAPGVYSIIFNFSNHETISKRLVIQ